MGEDSATKRTNLFWFPESQSMIARALTDEEFAELAREWAKENGYTKLAAFEARDRAGGAFGLVSWCETHRSAVTDPIDGDPLSCARAEWEPRDPDDAPELDEECRLEWVVLVRTSDLDIEALTRETANLPPTPEHWPTITPLVRRILGAVRGPVNLNWRLTMGQNSEKFWHCVWAEEMRGKLTTTLWDDGECGPDYLRGSSKHERCRYLRATPAGALVGNDPSLAARISEVYRTEVELALDPAWPLADLTMNEIHLAAGRAVVAFLAEYLETL
jgi:hypothetical protein